MAAPIHQKVVWIADGDSAVRSALKFALELEGLTVHTCASGAELLRHLAMAKVDCIVLEYRMSQADDLAGLDRLRMLPLHTKEGDIVSVGKVLTFCHHRSV